MRHISILFQDGLMRKVYQKICLSLWSLKRELLYIRQKGQYPIPDIYNRLYTSQLLAENDHLSISRYGDGELGQIINESNIGFQKYDQALSTRLKEILQSDEDPNILICIPDLFHTLSALKPTPRAYWLNWMVDNRASISRLLVNKTYGDSLVSRLYLPWIDTRNEQAVVNNLKTCWTDKHVILVEGSKTRWGIGNDLLHCAKSVRRIICPAVNAYAKYDKILSTCKQLASQNCVFILSLGPTATVLAYDLAKCGFRALDLGHFDLQYEFYTQNANSRLEIQGKYNNELNNGQEVGECFDTEYLRSIVVDINGKTL